MPACRIECFDSYYSDDRLTTGMSCPLSTALSSLDVENVLVYVADALRWDALPERVADRALTARGVASSIHTPTAFGSLVSGLYPPAAGVFGFENTVQAPTLFDVDAAETTYDSSMLDSPGREDSLFAVFDHDPDDAHGTLDDASPPFVHVERANGGHAPYGDSDLTGWEYFREHGHRSDEWLRADYERRVELDTDRFERRLATLDERGLREDTLVVYLADHGELLGEGGLLGHNGPMRPELVYVPVAFVHPDLPAGERTERFVRHIDLLPTVLDVLDALAGWSVDLDGDALTRPADPDYGLTFYDSTFFSDRLPGLSGTLAYAGAWNAGGGHVFAESPSWDRASVFVGKLAKSAKRSHLRRHARPAMASYLRGDCTYSSPGFDRETARAAIDQAYARSVDRTTVNLSAATEDRLESLGYL